MPFIQNECRSEQSTMPRHCSQISFKDAISEKRASVASIGGIKSSILEINLLLGLQKISGIVDKH